ncbi:MAG: hypothetical protein Q9183_002950 [Haloplaca sp. 2 TL-2023]
MLLATASPFASGEFQLSAASKNMDAPRTPPRQIISQLPECPPAPRRKRSKIEKSSSDDEEKAASNFKKKIKTSTVTIGKALRGVKQSDESPTLLNEDITPVTSYYDISMSDLLANNHTNLETPSVEHNRAAMAPKDEGKAKDSIKSSTAPDVQGQGQQNTSNVSETAQTSTDAQNLPSLPREATQPSDPVVHRHLMSNPQLVDFHNAARNSALDRTSLANFDLNFSPHQGSTTIQQESAYADEPFDDPPMTEPLSYEDANPEYAEFLKVYRGHVVDQTHPEDFNYNPLTTSPSLARANDQHLPEATLADQRHDSFEYLKNLKQRQRVEPLSSGDGITQLEKQKDHGRSGQKGPRNQARTRYHKRPGHAGTAHANRPQKVVVHHSAFGADKKGAYSLPQPGYQLSQPLPCQEDPGSWSDGNGGTASDHVDGHEQPRITHSAPVGRCVRARAHKHGSHQVCSGCRTRAMHHCKKYFKSELEQPKRLPICDECATTKIHRIAKPEDFENGKLKKTGCRCETEWLCFGCTLSDLQEAKMKYETHVEFRRGMTSTFDFEGTGYVHLGDRCICQGPITGFEKAWICSSCRSFRQSA